MEPALKELLSLPVKLVATDQVAELEGCDLLPESVHREIKERAFKPSGTNPISSPQPSSILILLAAGFSCLIWLQHRVNKIDAKIAAIQPDIDFVNSRVARWNALVAAIERERFVLELLFQVCSSLPSDRIRITSFEISKDQFMVESDSPSAALAIEFGDQLKKNPALGAFHFETGPPTLLENEHAQTRIFGKL